MEDSRRVIHKMSTHRSLNMSVTYQHGNVGDNIKSFIFSIINTKFILITYVFTQHVLVTMASVRGESQMVVFFNLLGKLWTGSRTLYKPPQNS